MTRESAADKRREVELVLGQLDALPPLSPVAYKVLALTDDEESATKDLIRLIETDPSLSARIISVLNSAEFGFSSTSLNIDKAVRMLGFNRVRQTTLALKVMEVFGVGKSEHERDSSFDRIAFWKHCLAVGCAARRLAASDAFDVDPNDAFVMGLLHDIGKLALHTVMPKSYARVVSQCDDARLEIVAAEKAMLGVDHTIAGRHLAQSWHLPARLLQCIWLHHHSPDALPPSVRAGGHVQLVHLSDIVARELHLGWSGNYETVESSSEIAARLHVDAKLLTAVMQSLVDDLEERAAWIGGERIDAKREYLTALLKTNEQLIRQQDEFVREIAKGQSARACLSVVQSLATETDDAVDVAGVCAISARSLLAAFGVGAVAVFSSDESGEINGTIDTRNGSMPFDAKDPANRAMLVELNETFGRRVDTVRLESAPTIVQTWASSQDAFNSGRSIRDLNLCHRGRAVGMAVFACDNGLSMSDEDATALSATIGASLHAALERHRTIALHHELAESGRRTESAQRATAQRRMIESVTAMAAGAAHELNNPLAVISGRAQIMAMKCADADLKKGLDLIGEKAKIASEIVNDLLEFAKAAEPVAEDIDLLALINAVLAELADGGLLAATSVELLMPEPKPIARFDRAQLCDCFKEVIRNAVESTADQTFQLTIKAAFHPTEQQIVVSAIDNGRGMTAESMGRAFDPFYSKRPAGRGRGLGLARVRRWMLLNGGDVQLESKPESGTRVVLRLPRAD